MKKLFMFWGKVKKGKQRGKLLGFPTANTALHKKIPEGIYASKVKINKKTYSAATFIGSPKTFNEKDYKSESYILDFDKNIYGSWVTITLFNKIRENKKFSSEQELIEQMKKDVIKVKSLQI